MNRYLDELKNISLNILRAQNIAEEIQAAEDLAQFYLDLQTHAKMEISRTNESALNGGLAISTYDAAICVNESLRTTRFIKGVHAAILELQKRFPHEKIRIFYAGCGPYATLVLPLLPLTELQSCEVTMLDLHPASLQCVEQFMQILFGGVPVQLVQGDALRYQLTEPAHLVVTETMFKALSREPQVGITKNLAPQLVPGGILVPQEINIHLVYTRFAEEPVFSSEKQVQVYQQPAYAHRKIVDHLFCISKEPDFFQESPGNKFVSKGYSLPGDMQLIPDICVFTELRIFNGITLEYAQSTITNPHGISSEIHFGQEKTFRLEYDFDQLPDWKIKIPAH